MPRVRTTGQTMRQFGASTFPLINFSTTSLSDVSALTQNAGLIFTYTGGLHSLPIQNTGSQFVSKVEVMVWGWFSLGNNTLNDGAIVNLYLDTQGSPVQGTAPNASAKRFTFLSNGFASVAGARWFKPISEWYEDADSVLTVGTQYVIYPTLAAVTGGTATLYEGEIMVVS